MIEMTRNIHELSARTLSHMVENGQTSATDLAHLFLSYAQHADEQIHAFSYLNHEAVLQQARILDNGRAQGGVLGRLAGVPIAVKDAIDTFDMPTEYGATSLSGRQPQWDAAVVKRLREAGAIIFGKTKIPEFCLGAPTDTRNPHNLEHTPGGSSSGSAAAVAAGMVPVAIGTQTIGSVIRPASFCGVIGFKPTRGLISRSGLQPLCESIDQVGVFGRDIEDVALVAEVLIQADENDPTTQGVLPRPMLKICQEAPPFPPKFVCMRTPFWDRMDLDAQQAFEALIEELGEQVVTIELPDIAAVAVQQLQIIVDAEFATSMNSHMLHTGEQVSEKTRQIVQRGRDIKAVDYLAALRSIESVTSGFDEFFDRFDAIITPSSLGTAPKGLGNNGDPVMNALWSFTGMPAISLPLLQAENGLPLGVQLVGAKQDDARLLRTSRWLLNKFTAGEIK